MVHDDFPGLPSSGKNKLIINHLGRLFVTSDAATIIREIEVIHPAAKLLVGASQAQEAEHGDGTNFVLIFAGELLKRAVNLLVMGMHPSEVVLGFEMASEKAREEIESKFLSHRWAQERVLEGPLRDRVVFLLTVSNL